MQRAAHVIERLVGTDTVRKTSVEVRVALAAAVPSLKAFGNASAGVGVWSGSLDYWQARKTAPADVHIDRSANFSLFVLGRERSDRGGWTTSYELPWLSVYDNHRYYGAVIGLENFLAAGLGVDATRGPFVRAEGGIPIAGPASLAIRVMLFYPPLQRLAEKARPPIAALQRFQERTIQRIQAAWRRLRPGRDSPG